MAYFNYHWWDIIMIIELPIYNKILVVLIDLVGIWLGGTVYQHNRKGKLNRIFIGMIILMFVWINFAYLARLVGENNILWSLIFLRIAWFATPLLFVLLYFFVFYHLKHLREEKKLHDFKSSGFIKRRRHSPYYWSYWFCVQGGWIYRERAEHNLRQGDVFLFREWNVFNVRYPLSFDQRI